MALAPSSTSPPPPCLSAVAAMSNSQRTAGMHGLADGRPTAPATSLEMSAATRPPPAPAGLRYNRGLEASRFSLHGRQGWPQPATDAHDPRRVPESGTTPIPITPPASRSASSTVCRQCRWRRAWRCYRCSRNCDVSAAPSPPSTDAYGSTPSRSIIAEAMEGRSAMSTPRTTWPRLSMLRLVAMTASTNPLPDVGCWYEFA